MSPSEPNGVSNRLRVKAASANHSNRRAHNWLAYDIGDSFLNRYSPLFKGVLYDFGAGESPYKSYFEQFVGNYVAVDWAQSVYDTNLDVVCDLNYALPIASNSADSAVSLSVLEHLHSPHVMLAEVFRILKPGASIVIQVPWQWRVHEAPHDYYRYSPYALDRMLREVGFEAILIEPQSGFFTMLILKMNYFSRRIIRGPNWLRFAIRSLLTSAWHIGQLIAPVLDNYDRHWDLETIGFFVTARKPEL